MFVRSSRGVRIGVLAAVLATLMAAALRGDPAAQSTTDSVCDIGTAERVVAVGDAHGAYDRFVGILRTAGLIDARDRWIGGRDVLVQTGDVLDRGPASRRILDLLRRLERDASRAGGRVHVLLGNHEVMRMIADWRYVSAEEYAAFRTSDSAALRDRVFVAVSEQAEQQARQENRTHDAHAFRDQFFKEIPLGYIEMRQAFDAAGDYGRWLRQKNVVIKINGIVFVHGGLNASTAAMGCEGINDAVRRDVTAENVPLEQALASFSSSETGPLWYRGLADEPEPDFEPELVRVLETLDARAIVVGHTVAPGFRIRTRFGGRVIQIDTGMLGGELYPGGTASALEIRGETLTAIYEHGRERLSVP